MNLLIFEGVDRSGKTTLRKALSEHLNHRWLTVDRWIHTHIVYGTLLNTREVRFNDMIKAANLSLAAFDNVVVVYCKPSTRELVNRWYTENLGEWYRGYAEVEEWYDKQLEAYEKAIGFLPYTITLEVDTGYNIVRVTDDLMAILSWVETGSLQPTLPQLTGGLVTIRLKG